MTDTPRLTLPPELSIVEVGALMPEWLSWLDRHERRRGLPAGTAVVDAHGVQAVDSAGLQMLVALATALDARGWRLQLDGVGEPLVQACIPLGLGGWLTAHRLPAMPCQVQP